MNVAPVSRNAMEPDGAAHMRSSIVLCVKLAPPPLDVQRGFIAFHCEGAAQSTGLSLSLSLSLRNSNRLHVLPIEWPAQVEQGAIGTLRANCNTQLAPLTARFISSREV